MVSLVRLSSSNIGEFKKLYEENFKRDTYDKDFFEYYSNQNFIPKILVKRFVKLFMYNGEFIGYIWHEIPIDIQVKVFSLYVKERYIDIINDDIFKKFNEKYLIYESIESNYSNKMLRNLGFKKIRPSYMMTLIIAEYKRQDYINRLYFDIKYNKGLLECLNNYSSIKNTSLNISFRKADPKEDSLLRCQIQNNVFENLDRVPIEVEDIESDIRQEYYLEDLAIFMKLNNTVVAYGQIIYIRQRYTIVNFGVIKEFRGYGLAKVFLDYLINLAKDKGISEVVLGVDTNNYRAISLYEWIGFKHEYNIVKWER